jgi:hypothetical protein
MLNVMRKFLLGGRCMAPRLDFDLLSDLSREAFGPVTPWVIFHHVCNGVRMDILAAVAHVV